MKKSFLAVVALLLAACMFMACTKGGGSGAATGQPVSDDPTQISANLTMWTGTWNDGLVDQLLREFQKTYPNINVSCEYTPWDGMEDRYFAAMQAGVIPDIIDLAIAWTIPFARMGHLLAVDDLAVKYGLNLRDTYYPGGLETAEVDGRHYALPYRTEVMTFIYNKDLFAQAGLDPDRGPRSWAEVVEMGEKISALGNGIAGFGVCGYDTGNLTAQVYSIMFSNGVELLSADQSKAAFNTPAGVEALEFWANLRRIAPASVMENDGTANRNLFAEGRVGMIMTGSYDLPAIYEANPNIKMGFVVYPEFKPNVPRRAQQGGWNIAMTSTCTGNKVDPAFLWIKFLASPEISVIYSNTISAAKAAINNPIYSDPDLEMFLESLQYGKPVPGNINMNAITVIMYNESQGVIAGTKSAQAALNDAERQVNALLAQ